MRSIFKLSIFILLISVFGCNDKLDIKPKNKVILSKVEEYSALLDYKYLAMYDNLNALSLCFDGAVYSEQYLTGNTNPFYKACYLGMEDIDRSVDYKTSDIYTKCYQRISRYNIIIDEVLDSKGLEKDRLQCRAEAKILRAYNHFVLVNIYARPYAAATAETEGGILLRDKFSLEDIPTQSSVAEAYRFIEKDIAEAIPYLAPKGINNYHPGLSFAYGLKAKVHLFKGEFDKAEEAAKEALKYNSYIFDLVGWEKGIKTTPNVIPVSMEENLLFGYGTNDISVYGEISPQLVAKYGTGDVRQEYFFWYSTPSMVPGTRTFKPKVNQSSIKLNQGGMRSTEVMLMLAECYARRGQLDDAMKLVNDIRIKRVRPESFVPLTASTKEEAFAKVLDERSRELVITYNNFWDIRRLEAEGIHTSVTRVLSDGTKYTVKSSSPLFTFPFPQNALDRSMLKQNQPM